MKTSTKLIKDKPFIVILFIYLISINKMSYLKDFLKGYKNGTF